MTKPSKKRTHARDLSLAPRVVYLIDTQNGKVQIEAQSVRELNNKLISLLSLDPYSVHAIARLAHIERASISGTHWSVRRLGVLQFAPDKETERSDESSPLTTQHRRPDLQPTVVSAPPAWMDDGQTTDS